ncbi:YceD family protein [Paraflavitalea pollutisoli]|uniref:YceD family protein n=1 Tax=Paraflavitalea pollutisoli TaxID=3034143 RepID=UPI0023EBA32B|nr:DUF177 domain-containing protein [Paraflavitalea sp. H1-2-19X]
MSSRRNYDIAFVGLKPGIHEFEYDIDEKFFVEYQEQDFRNCKAHVKLTLDKKTGFMLLKFEIGGQLEVTCDRCGNNLPLQLWDDFNIVVKMVEDPEVMNEQEEDPDVYYIARSESHLHIADWIYEFINLSIPMQRMCAEDEIGGSHCNKEVLDMLNKMDAQQKELPQNPLWKGLEQFKDLEDN